MPTAWRLNPSVRTIPSQRTSSRHPRDSCPGSGHGKSLPISAGAPAPRLCSGTDPFDSAQGHPEPVERMSLSNGRVDSTVLVSVTVLAGLMILISCEFAGRSPFLGWQEIGIQKGNPLTADFHPAKGAPTGYWPTNAHQWPRIHADSLRNDGSIPVPTVAHPSSGLGAPTPGQDMI